jgi:ubiquinone/menaquinone biosynthesis C-methylase UbiE
VRLEDRVAFRQGDALDLPFGEASFDIAWTQHAVINIADKVRLYSEAFRVLRPWGLFAPYDVLKGPGGPVHFQDPWAREPSISHLVTDGGSWEERASRWSAGATPLWRGATSSWR